MKKIYLVGAMCAYLFAGCAGNASQAGHDEHDCGCDGHNLAYFSTHISHFMDGDVDIHLMPLLVLFDYIYPPEPAFCGQLLDHENAPYIESLHDTWIVSASGLRAPPMS